MNQVSNDLKRITLNIELMSKKLEYLTKQLDKNKIKYPLGITYDQLDTNIYIMAKEDMEREFKIVRIV